MVQVETGRVSPKRAASRLKHNSSSPASDAEAEEEADVLARFLLRVGQTSLIPDAECCSSDGACIMPVELKTAQTLGLLLKDLQGGAGWRIAVAEALDLFSKHTFQDASVYGALRQVSTDPTCACAVGCNHVDPCRLAVLIRGLLAEHHRRVGHVVALSHSNRCLCGICEMCRWGENILTTPWLSSICVCHEIEC